MGRKKNDWSNGKLVSDYYDLARKYFPNMSEEELFHVLFHECDFYISASELQLEQKLINYRNSLKG